MFRSVLAIMSGVSLIVASSLGPVSAQRGDTGATNPNAARVFEHWTAERRANAIPRDLVIDERGLGYVRRPDGSLQPYGHDVAATAAQGAPTPAGKPAGNDSEPPTISNMVPGDNATIGASALFSSTVTDASGIKSVSFTIMYPSGATQSFNPSSDGGDTWSITLQGFTDNSPDSPWSWRVVAKDNASRGGNTATSGWVQFHVDAGSGGGDTGGGNTGVVSNAEWSGGAVQDAAGRIYFEMPGNSKRKGPWKGYVCSGTVVTDDALNDRSVILTAAHCVYDDVNKAFARNVLFIPNQAGTSGAGTDLNCNNDPLGCWAPSFGVVDEAWTARTFPNNVAWDYAYYVVDTGGAHSGSSSGPESLEASAGSLPISFSAPLTDTEDSSDLTHALGYSYSEDPNFMYCAEDMTTEGLENWWLPSCGLSGGSSGGPWVQPMDEIAGTGPVISVNSWGYTNSPGMAGPILSDTSARPVFECAETTGPPIDPGDGSAGIVWLYECTAP